MKITKARLKEIIKEELSNLFEDEMGSLEASPLVSVGLKAIKVPNIEALTTVAPNLFGAVDKINNATKKIGDDYTPQMAMQIVVAFKDMMKTKDPNELKQLTQGFEQYEPSGPPPRPTGVIGAIKDLATELSAAGFPAKYANVVNPSYRDYLTKSQHRIEFTGPGAEDEDWYQDEYRKYARELKEDVAGSPIIDSPSPSGDQFDGTELYKKTSEDFDSAIDYLMGKGWQRVMAGQAKDITVLVAGPRVEKKYRNYVLHSIQIPKVRGWRTNKNAFKGKSFAVTTKRMAKKKGLI